MYVVKFEQIEFFKIFFFDKKINFLRNFSIFWKFEKMIIFKRNFCKF